jgi:hypothetical protein
MPVGWPVGHAGLQNNFLRAKKPASRMKTAHIGQGCDDSVRPVGGSPQSTPAFDRVTKVAPEARNFVTPALPRPRPSH